MGAGYSITVRNTNYAFFPASLFFGFLTPIFFSSSVIFFTFFILLYTQILKTRCLGISVYLALIRLNLTLRNRSQISFNLFDDYFTRISLFTHYPGFPRRRYKVLQTGYFSVFSGHDMNKFLLSLQLHNLFILARHVDRNPASFT